MILPVIFPFSRSFLVNVVFGYGSPHVPISPYSLLLYFSPSSEIDSQKYEIRNVICCFPVVYLFSELPLSATVSKTSFLIVVCKKIHQFSSCSYFLFDHIFAQSHSQYSSAGDYILYSSSILFLYYKKFLFFNGSFKFLEGNFHYFDLTSNIHVSFSIVCFSTTLLAKLALFWCTYHLILFLLFATRSSDILQFIAELLACNYYID